MLALSFVAIYEASMEVTSVLLHFTTSSSAPLVTNGTCNMTPGESESGQMVGTEMQLDL